jgi:hypothetical protein
MNPSFQSVGGDSHATPSLGPPPPGDGAPSSAGHALDPDRGRAGHPLWHGPEPLTPLGVEQRNLVERVLWWQQLVLNRPVPAPLQGEDRMVHGLWLVWLGRLAVSDPGTVRNPITERSGVLPCHISCRAMTVLRGELGQPSLVIKVSVAGPPRTGLTCHLNLPAFASENGQTGNPTTETDPSFLT